MTKYLKPNFEVTGLDPIHLNELNQMLVNPLIDPAKIRHTMVLPKLARVTL